MPLNIHLIQIHLIQQHPQWNHIQTIYSELVSRGFRAVLTGGCVRDLLLQKIPHDLDMATNALPEDIEKIFSKTLMVGRVFGVSIVIFDKDQIEVATFRKDGEYSDGRHPNSIEIGTIEEDVLRRDFTVNALYYDLKTNQVLDFVGGQEDLKNRVLKCVGSPQKRFQEDHLRLLRGIRFMAQLGFSMEEATWNSVLENHQLVQDVSGERIRDEMIKFLRYANERAFGFLNESKMMDVIFPELKGFEGFCREHWKRLFPMPSGVLDELLLVGFLAPLALKKLDVKSIVQRLHLANLQMKPILAALHLFEESYNQGPNDFFNWRLGAQIKIVVLGEFVLFEKLVQILGSDFQKKKLQEILEHFRQISDSTGCLPRPMINTAEIQKIFGSQFTGKALGELLNTLYLAQLEIQFSQLEDAREWLKNFVTSLKV